MILFWVPFFKIFKACIYSHQNEFLTLSIVLWFNSTLYFSLRLLSWDSYILLIKFKRAFASYCSYSLLPFLKSLYSVLIAKTKKLLVRVLSVIRSISPSLVRKTLLIIPSEKISFCFKLFILYSSISKLFSNAIFLNF